MDPRPDDNDIGTRLLTLLTGLRGPGDIAPERLQEIVGAPVQYDPDDRNRYGMGAVVDDHWIYNLATIPDRAGDVPRRLVFSYDSTDAQAGDVPASAPEFEAFAQALRGAGYAQATVDGPRGALWGHRFTRDGVDVQVNTAREDAQARDIVFRVSRVTLETAASEVRHG